MGEDRLVLQHAPCSHRPDAPGSPACDPIARRPASARSIARRRKLRLTRLHRVEFTSATFVDDRPSRPFTAVFIRLVLRRRRPTERAGSPLEAGAPLFSRGCDVASEFADKRRLRWSSRGAELVCRGSPAIPHKHPAGHDLVRRGAPVSSGRKSAPRRRTPPSSSERRSTGLPGGDRAPRRLDRRRRAELKGQPECGEPLGSLA